MKKIALLLGLILLLVPFLLSAESMQFEGKTWTVGYGDWKVNIGRLLQDDEETGLAQIHVPVNHRGRMQIEFTVRYKEGGYNDGTVENGPYHGGFGIHVGSDGAPMGKVAWGNDESYLLWLNLDTRSATARKWPFHLGFRAQVYESDSHSKMDVVRALNIDILDALGVSMEDVIASGVFWKYLNMDVPIKIVLDTESGKVKVYDPSIDPREYGFEYAYIFNLDPSVLRKGRYLSLRNNDLGLIFDDFAVTYK